jgi:hypothetical protein
MSGLLLLASMAAAPSVIRVDMQDALRFPSGMETPPADPLVLFIRAPASWVKAGAITDAGKTALLAKLYGGPGWMNGNSDGSTYVVKSFKSRVLAAGEQPPGDAKAFWYDVKSDGTLEKKGPLFGEPVAMKQPKSLIDEAEKGSVFKQGPKTSDAKALLEWLGQQTGQVKLPVTLVRGQVGFSSRGAKAGALGFRCEDTALGISLADRARQACGNSATCDLWLIGDWKAGADPVLSVKKVEGAPSGAEREQGLWGHAWYQAG